MPKRGQRHYDRPGHNNPKKSQDMITGTYKKHETYKEQAVQHDNPGKLPPVTKAPHDHQHEGHTLESVSRIQTQLPEQRSGSDSNAHNPRKDPEVHVSHEKRQPEGPPLAVEDFDHDLHPNFLAGQNTRLDGSPGALDAPTAYDFKELHVLLADFSDAELRTIPVLPMGTRLEQGATYIDLKHRERGPFVALANMVAGPDNYNVPKKLVDYVTWNRLVGVKDPARLDEGEGEHR
jgi:hypothetical protein